LFAPLTWESSTASAPRTAYDTLRESLVQAVRAPLRRLRGNGKPKTDTIWALRDATFDVQPGECRHHCRNGAGKSTLLRVLSRITEPTLARRTLRTVASLLEVAPLSSGIDRSRKHLSERAILE